MSKPLLDPGGLVVPASALKLRRSREVLLALEARTDGFAKLIDCRKVEAGELIVLDVEVERPQALACSIQKIERIAVTLWEQDHIYPEVCSLRSDFPATLHLQQATRDYPRCFCLYDQSWPEVRVHWTGAAFVERIRWWLAGTAKGSLHADDQPLEPLLLNSSYWLVVPATLPASLTPCVVWPVGENEGTVLVVREIPERLAKGRAPNMLMRFESPPRTHGTSPKAPSTVEDVCQLLTMEGFDMLAQLRDALRTWPKDQERNLKSKIVLLVDLPKTAKPGGSVVATDRKAFLVTVDALSLGSAVGVWTLDGQKRSILVPVDGTAKGQNVKVCIANVTHDLVPDAAAIFNGKARSDPLKILAIGAGALGSQVALNLARAGFGQWNIVDSDEILPHNLARHALDGFALGWCKANALAITMNTLFSEPIAKAIPTDILVPGKHEAAVAAALQEAELVLDLSASVPVARHLAHTKGGGRRMSVFLSPSGRDMVMLCEDKDRRVSLDCLEMTYYAAIASEDALAEHLDPPPGRRRYGLSCRDLSAVMAQADVAMFAGIAARAIPQACESPRPLIRIWRSDPASGAVSVMDVSVDDWVSQVTREWTVQVSVPFLDQTAKWRRDRLPAETGGIIMGGVDHDRRTLYLTKPLPAPSDSKEYPTAFMRGSAGTRKTAEELLERTAGNLVYLGEWHSHPEQYATLPSKDDLIVLASVAELVNGAGQPGLIAIAGDSARVRVLLGPFVSSNPPEELWAQ